MTRAEAWLCSRAIQKEYPHLAVTIERQPAAAIANGQEPGSPTSYSLTCGNLQGGELPRIKEIVERFTSRSNVDSNHFQFQQEADPFNDQ